MRYPEEWTLLCFSVSIVAAPASCESDSCAVDEYCDNSTTTCKCNTTLYTFTPGSSPPVNLTCTGAYFNIQVSKCWLEAHGYNTSDIRLNSDATNCWAVREVVGGTSEMTIHRPLITSDCNTEAEMNATHVIYTNQLYIFAKTDPIQTQNDAVMNISCTYPLNMEVSLNVTLHPILGTTVINNFTGNASYVAVMMAFKDNTYTIPLSDSDTLTVEDNVYISVSVPGLDANTFNLSVLNIYASPTNASSIQYNLLQDGCPASDVSADQLTVLANGNGTESRFPMKVFQIASSYTVYLYAELRLCTNNCTTTCSPQSRSQIIQPIAVAGSAFCGSDSCAGDEYCDNNTVCQCNTTLYPFIRGSLPSPNLTCTGAKFNIQVSKCWLEANSYNTSDIRLNSTEYFAAREVVAGTSEMTIYRPLITSDYNTEVMVNSTHVIYTNQLYIFAQTFPITTRNDIVMDISCSYLLNVNVALNVTLHPIFGPIVINGPTADGSYSVYMVTYKENQFITQLSDSDILTVEDTIYISVIIPYLDTNTLHLKVLNIYASPTDPSSIKYYLLQDGCPANDVSGDQLTVGSNGNGTESRFAMKVFKITNYDSVYLYAELVLCTNNCNSTCSSQSITISQSIAGNIRTFMNAADYYYNENSANVAVSVPCGSDSCANDEYCDNNTTCQCDTTLYTNTGSLPFVNLTCTGEKFNIQVSKCWLEANGYNTSNMRLSNANSECWAVRQIVDGTSEMTLHRPLITSDCNTEAVVNSSHVTYTNQLYIFGKTDPIRTQNDAVMNISCSFPLHMNVKSNVTLHPLPETTVINVPTGDASYTAVMMAYKESTYTTPLSEDDPLTVEDIIYLSVRVPDLDVNTFKLKVVNIYASPTNSSDQKYYLLQNGCPGSDVPADQLTVDSNGVGIESRFAMKVFRITSSSTVYLYADLALCTTDCNTVRLNIHIEGVL
ncbi:uncharacterized protein [Aquarana catesbeiana]|uniref:uncharacterized protein n=1 Tax=Aquarana catesbeiana TaxID=8400 RepID=UPI003CC99EE2